MFCKCNWAPVCEDLQTAAQSAKRAETVRHHRARESDVTASRQQWRPVTLVSRNLGLLHRGFQPMWRSRCRQIWWRLHVVPKVPVCRQPLKPGLNLGLKKWRQTYEKQLILSTLNMATAVGHNAARLTQFHSRFRLQTQA